MPSASKRISGSRVRRYALFSGRRDLARPEERLLAARFLVLVLVGAAAIVAVEADPVVVVAHDRRDAALADQLDRLVRPRAVADQVAEAVDGIRRLGIDRGEHRFGGGAVAVQVGEDGDPGRHQRSYHSSQSQVPARMQQRTRRSASSGTNVLTWLPRRLATASRTQ